MRPLSLIITLSLLLSACTGEGTATDEGAAADAAALGAAYTAVIGAAVQQQIEDDVALNPLGRVFPDCLIADDAAVTRIGEALGVEDTTGEVLNVVVQDPDVDPTTQCAIRFGESSAGAVVLSASASTATPEEARAQLETAGFVEGEQGAAEGLDPERVLLLDSTQFDATRAAWIGDGVQVSLTANADIADTGALLQALPVAIAEIARVLGSE